MSHFVIPEIFRLSYVEGLSVDFVFPRLSLPSRPFSSILLFSAKPTADPKTMPPLTTAERIHAVEDIINYDFRDKSLLVKALEAAGATMAHQGNKRLALIGDAALRLILYELGYEMEASIGETP